MARRRHRTESSARLSAAVEVKLGRLATITGEVTRPIRSANLWNLFRRSAEMATKATEYKATRGLFDLTLQSREKAIANRAKRAHGRCMHNTSVGAELFAKDSRGMTIGS